MRGWLGEVGEGRERITTTSNHRVITPATPNHEERGQARTQFLGPEGGEEARELRGGLRRDVVERVVGQGGEPRPVHLRGRPCAHVCDGFVCSYASVYVRVARRRMVGVGGAGGREMHNDRNHPRPFKAHTHACISKQAHSPPTEDVEDLLQLGDVRVLVAPEQQLAQPHLYAFLCAYVFVCGACVHQ